VPARPASAKPSRSSHALQQSGVAHDDVHCNQSRHSVDEAHALSWAHVLVLFSKQASHAFAAAGSSSMEATAPQVSPHSL